MPRRKTGPQIPPHHLHVPFLEGLHRKDLAEDRRALARELALRKHLRAPGPKRLVKATPLEVPANPSPPVISQEAGENSPVLATFTPLVVRVSLPRCLPVPSPDPSKPRLPRDLEAAAPREAVPEEWTNHQIAVALLEQKEGQPWPSELRRALLARRRLEKSSAPRVRHIFYTNDGRRARARLPGLMPEEETG